MACESSRAGLPANPSKARERAATCQESPRSNDENTVCTTESYEYRVYCTDVNGSEVGYFGRQGEGPGEFNDHLPDLLRGPGGTIGVIDSDLNRMSVFEMATGAFVSQVRLPGVYFQRAASSLSSTLIGSSWLMQRDSAGAMRSHTRFAEVDVASGEVVWDRVYDSRFRTDAGCEDSGVLQGLHSGTSSSRGNVVFPLCRGQLLLFAGRDDASGTLIRGFGYAYPCADRPVGPGDADGYPDRGVDWCDISELEAPAYDSGS